jgi:hypothetical protein
MSKTMFQNLPQENALFKELCKRVNIKLEDIDLSEKNWNNKYKWTFNQMKSFQIWLKNKFLTDKEFCLAIAGKELDEKSAHSESVDFCANFGWKIKSPNVVRGATN